METLIWQSFSQEEVIVLGISNTSNLMQINNFIEENGITFPILFDSGSPGGVQGGDTYDLYYLPNNGSPYPRDFVIDHEQIIQYANNEIDTDWMVYVINELLIGNCTGFQIGDVNQDEDINILDIVLIINIILNIITPDECSLYLSDLNLDNSIDILDIVLVIGFILS